MELLPVCEKLERAVGECNWLDMMIVYFDDYASGQRDFARRLNRLVSEMNEACKAKVVVFLEEMMNKEGSREWELCDLEKEAKERVHEIEFFMGKLMRDVRG
ncbi:hypothetical protein Tco_0510409 [Tanacetum coccineum]